MKRSYLPAEHGFRVRLMSNLGRYPSESFRSEAASLIVSPEICFTIVRLRGTDWNFGQIDCITELELPLLGSILVAGAPEAPYLYPYPTPHSVSLETDSSLALDEPCIRRCRSFLLDQIQERSEDSPALSVHKPPILGGHPYEFSSEGDYSDWSSILHRLSTTAGPVILRGVSCLVKARMAFQHCELGEAACLHLWIALDAAHSLVLQELRESGIPNPTSSDAARFFDKMSGCETEWERFFEHDYANRISAIHPDNRFGAEAVPALMADDFFDLYDAIIPLFQFFISDLPYTR